MFYRLAVFLLLFVCLNAASQQSPANGAKLNYTQIMFGHPEVYGADEYIVQVAVNDSGGLFDPPFKEKIDTTTGKSQYHSEIALTQGGGLFVLPVKEWKDSSTATMVSGFYFGQKYIWRYAGISKGKKLAWHGPYTFETVKNAYADTNFYRVMVLKPDTDIKTSGLIVLDEMHSIVDRQGNFIWYLPSEPQTGRMQVGEINDLRLTSAGTLTFLEGKKAIETDLNGTKLWVAPKDTMPNGRINNNPLFQYNYNHCFMRLPNGHYMVQSKINELMPQPSDTSVANETQRRLPAGDPMSIPVKSESSTAPAVRFQYDLIKEFDKNGKLVWNWNSKNYFTADEIKAMLDTKPDSGILSKEPGGHLNAFNTDATGKYVYAGFRNISRVVKIDKATGNALHSWGAKMPSGGADEGDGFFLKQHDVALLKDSSIAVFSNGNIAAVNGKEMEPSAVVVFSQPANGAASKVTWRYDCRFNDMPVHSVRGGNVNELDNGNLLVCLGNVNRVLEINRSKQIVWQAQVAKYISNINMWTPKSLYRVHYTSSLYPCYFSIQTGRDTLTTKASSFNLKIFNDGSEEDTYVVKISSTSGRYNRQFTTHVIQSRKSLAINIAPQSLPGSSEPVFVSVISTTNPDFFRTARVQFFKKISPR